LESGDIIPITELKIGDSVLVHGGTFEPVYSFGHRNPTLSAEFVSIGTKNATLELSADHLVLIGHTFVPASLVQISDCLSDGNAVHSIKIVIRQGVYAPFTSTGTIVVSGITSSSYITLQKDSSHLMLGSFQTPFHLPVACKYLRDTSQDPREPWRDLYTRRCL
jgi:Hint module